MINYAFDHAHVLPRHLFPQRNARVWTKLIAQNHRPILRLVKEGYGKYANKKGARPMCPPHQLAESSARPQSAIPTFPAEPTCEDTL